MATVFSDHFRGDILPHIVSPPENFEGVRTFDDSFKAPAEYSFAQVMALRATFYPKKGNDPASPDNFETGDIARIARVRSSWRPISLTLSTYGATDSGTVQIGIYKEGTGDQYMNGTNIDAGALVASADLSTLDTSTGHATELLKGANLNLIRYGEPIWSIIHKKNGSTLYPDGDPQETWHLAVTASTNLTATKMSLGMLFMVSGG